MKRKLLALVPLLFISFSIQAQSFPGQALATQYAQWRVPSYAPNSYVFPPTVCAVTLGKQNVAPIFNVNAPVRIVDADPTMSEIVTPTAVQYNNQTCAISVSPINQHNSFSLQSGTCGLQEAINAQNGIASTIIITPDFTTLGCTTSTITSAIGSAPVFIVDERTGIWVPYQWISGAYHAVPSGGATAAGPPGSIQIAGTGTNLTFDPNFTFNSTTQVFDTPSVYGNYIPGTNAVISNRDKTITVSPYAFGAQGDGVYDDSQAFDRAMQYLSNIAIPFGYKKILDGSGIHKFVKANYLFTGPWDAGDYLNTSAGSGASVGFQVGIGGAIQSCFVSGGSGYNPNAYLPVQLVDYSYMGSGAVLRVQTNGSGVPSACNIIFPGMNYPVTGVLATVLAIGADGAAGTCALSGGTFTSPCTVTAGGNGYTTAPAANMPGLTCTGYPTLTTTVSSSQIATITTTAGNTCTYFGSNVGTVPVAIGMSINGAQANNVVPETPYQQGCAVALRPGITIKGGTYFTDWYTGQYNSSQLMAFCEPWGNQGNYIGIQDAYIASIVDMGFSGPMNQVRIENVTCGYAGGQQQNLPAQPGGGICILAPQMTRGTVIRDLNIYSPGGIICGGFHTNRGGGNGSGSQGGAIVGLQNSTQLGGSCDDADISSVNYYPYAGTMVGLPGTGNDNYRPELDSWFDQNWWKTYDDATVNPNAWNGNSQCYNTISGTQRNTDFNFGYNQTVTTNPRYNCYQGISDMAIVMLSRDGYLSAPSISNVTVGATDRAIIYGNLNNVILNNIIHSTNNGGHYTDPYLPTSVRTPGSVFLTAMTSIQLRASVIRSLATTNNIPLPLATYNKTAQDFSGVWADELFSFNANFPSYRPANNGNTAALTTKGSGVGTVSCLNVCSSLSGTVSVAGGTFTTGTFLTPTWTATSYTPRSCVAYQMGGTSYLGINVGTATTTSIPLTNAVTVASTTFIVHYECTQ